MKNFLILTLLLTVASCSSLKKEEEKIQVTIQSKNFMDETLILNEFQRLSESEQIMAEKLSDDALKRFATLKDDLLSPEEINKLNKSRSERQSKENFMQKNSIGKVDRRSCDNDAVSQCGGTCTSHGITNAIDNLICNPKQQNSSNQSLWSKYERYSTNIGIKAAKDNYFCDEKYWPNCGVESSLCKSNSHIKLKATEYLGNDVQSAKEMLDKGFPLVYSGKVTRSWLNCDAVVNPKSAALSGGHAVAVVGYKDEPSILGGGYFLILNSWGKNCGDGGYQYLPFEYCNRTDNQMYCFMEAIKEVESKYAGNPVPNTPEPEPDCRRVRYCKRSFKCLWLGFCECGPWKTICK